MILIVAVVLAITLAIVSVAFTAAWTVMHDERVLRLGKNRRIRHPVKHLRVAAIMCGSYPGAPFADDTIAVNFKHPHDYANQECYFMHRDTYEAIPLNQAATADDYAALGIVLPAPPFQAILHELLETTKP